MFPDMPWMVGDDGLSAEVRTAAAQAFGDSGARRGRLFAFGLRRAAHRALAAARRADQSAGADRHAEHRSAGSRAPRARMGAHQGRLSRPAGSRLGRPRQANSRAPPATLPSPAWIAVRPDRWPKTAPAPSSKSQGFTIVARNFLRRVGELDVVARAGDLLVIAEVRTRASEPSAARRPALAAPSSAASPRPPRLLLQSHRELRHCRVRFDVIIVRNGAIEWLKHAFDA